VSIASPTILLLSIIVLAAGCAGLDTALYRQEVVDVPGAVTATNTVLRTNVVVIVAGVTNSAPTAEDLVAAARNPDARIQNIITPEVTYAYAPPTLRTNLVPRPLVEDGLKATGALPLPYAGTAGLVLGWLYTAYAAWRNKKLSVAVVKSVQAGREFLQSTPEGQQLDQRFKEVLVREQGYDGVVREVRKLLDRYVSEH
jgi:hypothetical protein